MLRWVFHIFFLNEGGFVFEFVPYQRSTNIELLLVCAAPHIKSQNKLNITSQNKRSAIEQKGMTFVNDFCYSFSISSPLFF